MNEKPLVLLVDDEAHLLNFCQLELMHQDFHVEVARDGRTALRMAEARKPAVVVLDIVMPGMDGFEVLAHLRRRFDVPVLMLTARAADRDKVQGLELGAAEYLAKPFNPEELAARLRAILRRRPAAPDGRKETTMQVRDIEIDLTRRLARKAGNPLRFTRREWLVLERLASRPGRVVPHAELMRTAWGPEHTGEVQRLRVCVLKLRSKLEDRGATLIRTVSGKGYVFDPAGQPDPGPDAEMLLSQEAGSRRTE